MHRGVEKYLRAHETPPRAERPSAPEQLPQLSPVERTQRGLRLVSKAIHEKEQDADRLEGAAARREGDPMGQRFYGPSDAAQPGKRLAESVEGNRRSATTVREDVASLQKALDWLLSKSTGRELAPVPEELEAFITFLSELERHAAEQVEEQSQREMQNPQELAEARFDLQSLKELRVIAESELKRIRNLFAAFERYDERRRRARELSR